jgi:hypothetical protein
MWDQTAFNDLARLGHTNSDTGNKNLWKGDQGKLTMGVLPASIFASGHMFFVQVRSCVWCVSVCVRVSE